MKRGMKLISNAVLLATIVNINLYASSKDWENIDNLEKSGKIEESVKLKNQLIDTIKKDYLKQYPKEELGLKALENISQLQPQIQEILFKCFDLGIEKIKDEKIQKQYTLRITAFFQGVNKNSGGLEEYAQKNLETLPGFAQSDLYKVLLTFAKQSDDFIKGEIEKEIQGQQELDKKSTELDKKNALWDKLLGDLKSIKENK
ncbi:MAG: hypothetical protein PHD79_12040 [Aliarcobacter sp.]|nr:hypothetical protein [Aliarcobacter sp.]